MENPVSANETTPLVSFNNEKKPDSDKFKRYANHNSNGLTKDVNTSTKKKSKLKTFASLSGRKKYTLLLITIATFLSGVAFSVLGPFFPTKAVEKGMSIGTVGVVFGIFEVIIFLTAPLFGNFLVKIGPRFVFVSGIFLGGSCNILFGTLQYCPSGTPFIVMSILVRSVEAIGCSAFVTSSFAIVSSEFKDNIALTFGILQTGSGLGFMLGPTIGGALYELGGFGLPFYFAGVSVLLNGVAVYKFLPIVDEIPTKRKGSMLSLLRSPMIIIPMCSVFIGVGGITTYDSTFAKRLEPLKLSVGMIGVLFGTMSGIYTIMSSIWGYITDNKNIQSPLMILGHLLFGVGFLFIGNSVLLPFLPFDILTVMIGLVCIGVSFGCTLIPTMKCMVIGAIELGFENNMDTNALVSGLFSSVQTLGGFVGPVGIGQLIEAYDYPVAYSVLGMCSIFMAVVSFIFFASRRITKKSTYTRIDKMDGEEGVLKEEDFISSGNVPKGVTFTGSRRMSFGTV